MKVLVTHHAPDVDAITSVWLFKQFDSQHFANAKVEFVNAGEVLSPDRMHELNVTEADVVHVDTGKGVFDHHYPERAMQRVCAASLVYDYVCGLYPNLKTDWALKQIVEYAQMDDFFEQYFYPEPAHERYLFDFSSLLHGLEFSGLHTDESQLAFGMRCLDGYHAGLHERAKAMQELSEGLVFMSKWGKAIGVSTANQGVLKYAQLLGYDLVIQQDPKLKNIRIKAAPKPEIDLTPLYEDVMKQEKRGDWYFHPGKHMLLNGSKKANGSHNATSLSLHEVILMAQYK